MDWPLPPDLAEPIFLSNVEDWLKETGIAPLVTSAPWGTANAALLTPVTVRNRMTVKQLYAFNGATVSGNCEIGLYESVISSRSLIPGELLVGAGPVGQAGTDAWQAFNVTDMVIAAGVYWLSYKLDNTTGAVTRLATFTFPGIGEFGLGNIRQTGGGGYPLTLSVPLMAIGGIA